MRSREDEPAVVTVARVSTRSNRTTGCCAEPSVQRTAASGAGPSSPVLRAGLNSPVVESCADVGQPWVPKESTYDPDPGTLLETLQSIDRDCLELISGQRHGPRDDRTAASPGVAQRAATAPTRPTASRSRRWAGVPAATAPARANCVEVALGGPAMGVRDSKDPGGPALAVPASAGRSSCAGSPRVISTAERSGLCCGAGA